MTCSTCSRGFGFLEPSGRCATCEDRYGPRYPAWGNCRGCGERKPCDAYPESHRVSVNRRQICRECLDSGAPLAPKKVLRPRKPPAPCRACLVFKPRDAYPEKPQSVSSRRRGICLECLPSFPKFKKHRGRLAPS